MARVGRASIVEVWPQLVTSTGNAVSFASTARFSAAGAPAQEARNRTVAAPIATRNKGRLTIGFSKTLVEQKRRGRSPGFRLNVSGRPSRDCSQWSGTFPIWLGWHRKGRRLDGYSGEGRAGIRPASRTPRHRHRINTTAETPKITR